MHAMQASSWKLRSAGVIVSSQSLLRKRVIWEWMMDQQTQHHGCKWKGRDAFHPAEPSRAEPARLPALPGVRGAFLIWLFILCIPATCWTFFPPQNFCFWQQNNSQPSKKASWMSAVLHEIKFSEIARSTSSIPNYLSSLMLVPQVWFDL
jgi:hypothetical protein